MYLAVFVGGALGSLLREVLSLEIPGVPFVTATFGINIAACLFIGWLYAVRHRVHAYVIHLGAVGFCGGLSTFSSFVAELDRLHQADVTYMVAALTLEVVLGLAAAILGEAIGRKYHAGEHPDE
ncbi:CrcB family protein [Ruegeria sp. HKCCA4633]|uniref:fluoride efflux transporter FluC n=1 Tax=Ruegeria sp. HKCCA4633 TaxID=2682983 RepID=UPI00148920F4|nr:CrcB family protein [Ruegeria sp. HKCCA4633]